MGVFSLSSMTQPFVIPQQFQGNNAYCIRKINSILSTYAVATDKGVYIVNIQGSQVNNIAHMLATKDVLTLRNIGDKLICGTWNNEYFLVDYKKKEEKKLCQSNDRVRNMDLLSLIDAKYSNLVITRDDTSLNILNITTATLTKLVDIPSNYWYHNDNQMQVIPKDKDNFSVVVIDYANKEILKFTVKTALLDVLIA